MKRIALLLTLSTLLYQPAAQGQLTVTDSIPVDVLVNDIFNTGTFVEVSNVTFNGEPAEGLLSPQIGLFANGFDIDLPIDSGLALTTGEMRGLFTEEEAGFFEGNFFDPDVLVLTQAAAVNHCAVLEFDVLNLADALAFNFSFASIEYTNFTCSQFNDAFGLFISGPGIDGPFENGAINIATIPDSEVPIAINTVNGGVATGAGTAANCEAANPNWQNDTIYFISNIDMSMGNIAFNGMTVNLEAFVEVDQNETYHIKFAICDATDTALDSGIMLEANSFEGRFLSDSENRRPEEFRLFPNPAHETATIVIPEAYQGRNLSIGILDIQGRWVTGTTVNRTGPIEFSVSDLDKGIYLVEVSLNGKRLGISKLVRD